MSAGGKKYTYTRATHFKQQLAKFQQKGADKVPLKVMAQLKQHIADEKIDATTLTHRDVRKMLIECGFGNMTHLTTEVESGLLEKQPINLDALVAFDDNEPVSHCSTSSLPVFEDCSICFDQITAETQQRLQECQHAFHAACIALWLQTSQTCPLCRARAVVEQAIGFDCNAFAQKYRGKSLETLLTAMYKLVLDAYETIVAEKSRNFCTSFFCMAKMAELLVVNATLCAENKTILKQLIDGTKTLSRRGANELIWRDVLKALEKKGE